MPLASICFRLSRVGIEKLFKEGDKVTEKERAFERQLKRQALQLASMLPDDPNAAVKVLGYAYDLIEGFIRPNQRIIDPRSTGGPLRLVSKDGTSVNP